VTRVLRYPKFQELYGLTDSDLLDYMQFLQSVSQAVILDPHYRAPMRDPADLPVLQTAESGEADILCSTPMPTTRPN
jgi:predicted nucleic acid-binding protein